MSGLGFWFGGQFYPARQLPAPSPFQPNPPAAPMGPPAYHSGWPPELLAASIEKIEEELKKRADLRKIYNNNENRAGYKATGSNKRDNHQATMSPAVLPASIQPSQTQQAPAPQIPVVLAPAAPIPAQATRSCQACRARQRKCGAQLSRCAECVHLGTKCEYEGTVAEARARVYPDDFFCESKLF